MVHFTTEPQPPLTTILKSQMPGINTIMKDGHYNVEILFVDIDLGRKYAKVYLTNQISGDDSHYIYEDRFKFQMKDYHLRIRNHSPLWNVLRKMLVTDGFMGSANYGAILITPIELKEYLTNRTFRIQGKNIHSYYNVMIPGGDFQ